MIKLFELVNGRLIATEHCYALKFLSAIMTAYPQDYIKVYQYLFYKTCPSPDLNPFFHAPVEDKDEMITEELELSFSLEDELIIDGLAKCTRLYSTETSRAYEGIKQAMDNIATYMRNTVITDGKDGNISQIRATAKDFDQIRQSFNGTYKALQEEQASKIRGNKNLAYDEDDTP